MMKGDRADKSSLEDEPFLSRWSKRKLELEQEQLQTKASREVEPDEADSKKALPELTDADMPPLESLDEEADYSVFLSPKVSEALRQQALQRLFRSACFNVCDGLDDYAEDFTRFDKLGDLITAEWRSRLQQEAKKAAERAESALGETESPPRPDQSGARQVGAELNAREALQAVREPDQSLTDTEDPAHKAT